MEKKLTLSDNHDKEKWASREQQVVTVLYDNARDAFLGSLFNILLVTFVLWGVYPSDSLLVWGSIGLILNGVRLYNHRLYVQDPALTSTRNWLKLHRILTFCSGCLYGALAIFFFMPDQPIYQALIIFLVGGMGAAAVGTYAVDLTTYRLFLFSAVIPLIIRAVMEQTEVHITLAIMLVSVIIVMLRTAKQANAILIENFDMSHSLQYRATHDGLVGLLNRDEFKNLFLREQSASVKKEDVISFIFIDLDNFKRLNDTYGHQAGDDALIKIGDIIRGTIRKNDIAARFGGDEFMILIRSESVEAAKAVAEKIIEKINVFQNLLRNLESKLGASIGIAYTQNPTMDFDTLLATADQACYQAKLEGKGRYCIKEAP